MQFLAFTPRFTASIPPQYIWHITAGSTAWTVTPTKIVVNLWWTQLPAITGDEDITSRPALYWYSIPGHGETRSELSSAAKMYRCGYVVNPGICNCPPMLTFTDFNPKTIPYMGAQVTITGSGFNIFETIKCSAMGGYDPVAEIIDNTTVICPFRYHSVDNNYGMYVWDANQQSATVVHNTALLTQDNNRLPVITSVYVLVDGVRTNYISRCTAVSQQLIIEGTPYIHDRAFVCLRAVYVLFTYVNRQQSWY